MESPNTLMGVKVVIHIPRGATVSEVVRAKAARLAQQNYDPAHHSMDISYVPHVWWPDLASEFDWVLPCLEEARRYGWAVDYPPEQELDALLLAMDRARDWLYRVVGTLVQMARGH